MKVNGKHEDIKSIRLEHKGVGIKYRAFMPSKYERFQEEVPFLEIEFRDIEEALFLMRALEGFVRESKLYMGEWRETRVGRL